MIKFSELGITTKKSFVGDSILIEETLGKEIVVEDFKFEPSIKTKGTECMHLQVNVEGKQRVIFTGSTVLIDQAKKVKEDQKPFSTTIVKVNRHFEFK